MNPQNDPRYGMPAPGPGKGFTFDPKALSVAGIAMGITLVLWLLQSALGDTGWIIALLTLLVGGGYVLYRGRNPERAHTLEARLQQLTRDRLASANQAVMAPPSPNPLAGGSLYPGPAGGPVYRATQPTPWLPATGGATQSASTGALVSVALLIPTLIAYAWRYKGTGFTDVWQPWWILTALNLYFVVCVAFRSRYPGKAPLAVLLGLAGTALIALANNPSDDVTLMKMFSSKRYYDGDWYPVSPSADVMLWIGRTPILAVLLFVAAWGVARRRQSGWVLGMIPAALLVWWAIYGYEHGFAWRGEWFPHWLLSVGVFVGGCLCCWLADLFTSGRGVMPGGMPYAPPAWPGPASPPVPPPVPPAAGPPPAHADYRAQASQHFQNRQSGGPGDAH